MSNSHWADVTGIARLAIGQPTVPVEGEVVVPGSKSLSNRALVLAALASGTSRLTGVLDAEDTRLMIAALRRCGVEIVEADERTTLSVTPPAGGLRTPDEPDTPLWVGTAGTVGRFLPAVLAGRDVTVRLDGTARMRERPMGQLLDVLVAQGARLEHHGEPGFLPCTLHGGALRGGVVELDAPASSQIVSALLLAGLAATSTTTIVLRAGTPARPYVDMTLATIRAFGGTADWDGDDRLVVEPGGLVARDWHVEPDASAATYPLALAALRGGTITVPGLDADSLQGDVAFLDVLAAMGADTRIDGAGLHVTGTGGLHGVDVDLTALPDPGLTLAALAVHAKGPTRIRGVEVHRHHETDRIAAAATELRRLGAEVVEHDDGLSIDPPATPTSGPVLQTYLDHRMAMAFALVGDVVLDDPGCVGKTWPGYFTMLDRFGMVRGEA